MAVEAPRSYAEIYDSCDDESEWIVDSTVQTLIPFFDKLVWAPNESIMDHGCGTGENCLKFQAHRAQQAGSKIFGVDISDSMINYARAKYSHPNVEYVLGDILSPDFPLERMRFQKIFSIFALRNVQHKIETIRKWFELLRPGGDLILFNVVETPHVGVVKYLKEHPEWGPLLREDLADCYWYPEPSSDSSEEERGAYHMSQYRDLLTHVGFVVHEILTYPMVRRHPRVDICAGGSSAIEFKKSLSERIDWLTTSHSISYAEVSTSSNPLPFDKCVKSLADQQRLQQVVCEYLAKNNPNNSADANGRGVYDELVLAVALRATKPNESTK